MRFGEYQDYYLWLAIVAITLLLGFTLHIWATLTFLLLWLLLVVIAVNQRS